MTNAEHGLSHVYVYGPEHPQTPGREAPYADPQDPNVIDLYGDRSYFRQLARAAAREKTAYAWTLLWTLRDVFGDDIAD